MRAIKNSCEVLSDAHTRNGLKKSYLRSARAIGRGLGEVGVTMTYGVVETGKRCLSGWMTPEQAKIILGDSIKSTLVTTRQKLEEERGTRILYRNKWY